MEHGAINQVKSNPRLYIDCHLLFNLHEEYVMRNTELEKIEIKAPGRNINYLCDDTILMVRNEKYEPLVSEKIKNKKTICSCISKSNKGKLSQEAMPTPCK